MRSWMRKSLARSVGLGLGLTLLAGAAALPATAQEAKSVKWSMATYVGGHWLEFGMRNFASLVDEMTEGRVKISVTQPGTLGSALKVTDSVRTGVAEVGHNWPAYDWGADRAGVPFGGWAGGLTPEEYLIWLYNEGGAEMWREWREEKFDVVSFPCALAETEIFLHSHKPVRTLEDFKGLRIRTSGAWAEIAAELGATTTIMPGAEVFSALERRVIDAIEWAGPGSNYEAGFPTIAEYIVVPGIHAPASGQECMFNKDAWAELSPHDQRMIELAAKLNTFMTFGQYGEDDLAAWDKLKTGDNTFVTLDQSFIDAARAASLAWAETQATENAWFKRAYDSQKALQEKLATWQEFRLPIGAAAHR